MRTRDHEDRARPIKARTEHVCLAEAVPTLPPSFYGSKPELSYFEDYLHEWGLADSNRRYE